MAEGDDGRRPDHRLGDDADARRTMTAGRAAAAKGRGLEQIIGVVLRAGVAASSVCLAAGLVLAVLYGEGWLARLLLNTGIVVLLMTPVARVVVSIVQYASDRDWAFTLLTAIVLVELLASAVAALVLNRRF
jgi:uncharacterized membrane protein